MEEQSIILQLGPVGLSVSLLTSWGITLLIGFLCFLLSRRLRIEPGPLQTLLEGVVTAQERAIAQVVPAKPPTLVFGAISPAGSTKRLRYHSARPPRSRTPCTIPSPRNQCCVAGSAWRGFGPLRIQRPSSSAGSSPTTGRSKAVSSSSTGAMLPARYSFSLGRSRSRSGAVSVMGSPSE